MSRPLISILVPCHNAGPWIGQALRSAQDQTWPKVEIIVVDDGSTDGSYEIAREFASASCEVIRQERGGASAARNRALARAQGEYIQYLDADDFLAPDKLEVQLGAAVRDGGKLSFGSAVHFEHEDRECVHLAKAVDQVVDSRDFLIRLWSGTAAEEMVQTGQWLTPRDLIEKAGPWNEDLSVDDDGEFFTRVLLAAQQVVGTPHAYCYYRKFATGENLSASCNRAGAMSAAILKCSHLLDHFRNGEVENAVRRQITREIVRAYPRSPAAVRAGTEFLHSIGLSMQTGLEGSPWFLRLYPHIGWKAARRLQAGWTAAKSKLAV